MAPQTLLQLLQTSTVVDCDTMDFEVAKSLGPFVDCTSNQAIAFFELSKPHNVHIVKESIELAKKLAPKYPDVPVQELAVEIALAISTVITGFVHVQTNPYHSYDTSKMVSDSKKRTDVQGIISLFTHLSPDFPTSRICLKIPSSWEGLQACRILQSESPPITTLATTLFNMEQAAVAGEVGCHYIAPYVNELKVHFEPGFVDPNKAHSLCLDAYRYYKKHGIKTQVLPASLTSTDEIMKLKGVDHITISEGLLRQLIEGSAEQWQEKSLFEEEVDGEVGELMKWGNDEKGWRMAFTRSGNGEGERKLSQTNLEKMMMV
ncbi:transaldolase protein [Rutstroemia sp. NJR-2017a BBW]|nr:transaldolase protein [Rutstroemia sp. NJR-2017a BBW]